MTFLSHHIVVVQSLSQIQLFVTSWTTARQAPLSFTISQSLLKAMSIESLMLSDHLILWHPLFLLPSTFHNIRVFSNQLALCIRWSKYWNFSFSNSPSNDYSELISSRINRFDLLAIQGTLKSLLQHHNLKASFFFFGHSALVQLSYSYMTTGKTILLTIRTLVSKLMSLHFNTLTRFAIAFLPRSKHLLLSWLQSSSTVILEPRKITPVTVSSFSPSICHEVMGPDAMILVFLMLSFKPVFFTLLFHPHQEALQFLFTFCH